MKRIASTLVVAGILLGTAIYYGVRADTSPDPPPPSTDQAETHPQPTTRRHVDGTLNLEAATSRGYLSSGREETFYASIDVTADDSEGDATRAPLNLALVIDRSGSMRGKKISKVREAAHTFVEMLEPDDRLSIVTYQSQASVDLRPRRVIEAQTEQMHATIDGIRAGGGTNIEAGVRQARRLLTANQTDASVNRILLLSDGKPTVGASSIGQLSRLAKSAAGQDVSVTTMGVGLDYNEQLLTRMANVGGGNYYFIDAPDKVVSKFQKELGGLAETVAKSTSLVIDLGDDIELGEVHGYPSDTSDGRVRLSLSEFFAGQTKSVLLELRGRLTDREPQSVLDVDLSYRDLREDHPAHQRASLTAAASEDPDQIDDSIDRSVVARVQQVEVASRIDQAMEAFENGEEQRAESVLEESRRQVRRAKDNYDLSEDEVEPVDTKLQNVQKQVDSHSASSGAGQTVIKRQRAESNEMMLDSSSLK